MQFRKPVAAALNLVVNELLPPVLRDSRWVMYPLFRLAFGEHARLFMEFREKSVAMTHEEYVDVYRITRSCDLKKASDLSDVAMRLVAEEIAGERVLDVGCGRGLLARTLSDRYDVTATDVVRDETMSSADHVRFVEAPAEALPFEDRAFDTVVCAHVLEHVRDLDIVLGELRRVAARRLIILLPIERPYRFGFNLHLRFFPYAFTVMSTVGKDVEPEAARLRRLRDEWMYVEDIPDGRREHRTRS